MPITVDYGPAPGLIGAAAREVGGAEQIARNNALRAQIAQHTQAVNARQLEALIGAYTQQAGIQERADESQGSGAVNLAAIANQRARGQEQDYAQVYAQRQQQQFQQEQQSRLFEQQQGLADQREQGRYDRTGARIDLQDRITQLRLTAPERMRVQQIERQMADIDQGEHSGRYSPQEAELFRARLRPEYNGFQQRQSRAQALLVESQQDAQRDQVRMQGELAVANFQARIVRSPTGDVLRDPNGSPLVLDQHGMPQPMFQPPVSGQHLAQMYTQVAQDLTRTEGTGPDRRVIQPSPEDIQAEVLRRAQGIQQIQQAMVGQAMGARPYQPPAGFTAREAPPPLDGRPVGSAASPHPGYDRDRERFYDSAAADIVRSPGMPDQPEALATVQGMQQLERMYGTVANMPPPVAQRFAAMEANVQRLGTMIQQREAGRAQALAPAPPRQHGPERFGRAAPVTPPVPLPEPGSSVSPAWAQPIEYWHDFREGINQLGGLISGNPRRAYPVENGR